MAERKINLASDDAYIQCFNRLKATHDVSKKIKNNDDNDNTSSSVTHRSSASKSDSLNDSSVVGNIVTTNKATIKIKRNTNNVLQVPERVGKHVELDPLPNFPTYSDTFAGAFFGIPATKPQQISEYEKYVNFNNTSNIYNNTNEYDYHGNRTDPYTSVSLDRIDNNKNFIPLKSNELSLTDIENINGSKVAGLFKTKSKNKKFVLVEESKLAELTKYEHNLRIEREKIGYEFEWFLDDIKIDPRIPIPATRKAMNKLCDDEIDRLTTNINELNKKWSSHSKQNHYNKPHLFEKNSADVLNCGPKEQRMMKLRLVREAVESWKIRKDRDMMTYEDNYSYLIGKYKDIKNRKVDYDRYFVLATRYGQLSEKEYNKDDRPGMRYWLKVQKAALSFQRAWDCYWSVCKLRRYRAARLAQAHIRRYFTYKKLHPIIVMRMKHGKKTYYKFVWARWKHYNRLVKNIRAAIARYKKNEVENCFTAWKGWVQGKSNRKNEILRKFKMRMTMSGLAGKFLSWAKYAKYCKRVKTMFRRLITKPGPQFDMWLTYVHNAKALRIYSMNAVPIQAQARCHIYRNRYLKTIKSVKFIHAWFQAYKRASAIRKGIYENEFPTWSIEETERRRLASEEAEQSRQARIKASLKEKEKSTVGELKRHQAKWEGKYQLYHVAEELTHKHGKKHNHQQAQKHLLDRCLEVHKSLEAHDMVTKVSFYARCPVASCHKICANDHSLHDHLDNSDHIRALGDKFKPFFLMFRHEKGTGLIKAFLMRKLGFDSISNCYDFILNLQEWRNILTKVDMYTTKGIALTDLFLKPTGTRYIGYNDKPIAETIARIDRVKNRKYNGWYEQARAKPNTWRKLLGLQGPMIAMWTDANMLLPTAFDEAEWFCLNKVYEFVSCNDFESSKEMDDYRSILAAESKGNEKQFFLDYKAWRKANYVAWAKMIREREFQMIAMADTAANLLLDQISTLENDDYMKTVINEKTFVIRHEEQRLREKSNAMAEDAVTWAEENILDDVWSYFLPRFLNTMLAKPDLVKGLLEYAGMLKFTKKLSIDFGKKQDDSWFDQFLTDSLETEKEVLPLNPLVAVARIQNRIRGVLARNRVRKLYTGTFIKKYDPEHERAFYINQWTSEVTWEKPHARLFRKLYPRSTW